MNSHDIVPYIEWVKRQHSMAAWLANAVYNFELEHKVRPTVIKINVTAIPKFVTDLQRYEGLPSYVAIQFPFFLNEIPVCPTEMSSSCVLELVHAPSGKKVMI